MSLRATYTFQIKTRGKKVALFRYPSKNCFASISLKTYTTEESAEPQVIEPFEVTNLNLIHVETCKAKPEEYFREISFIKNVKESVKTNPLIPLQQLYDRERTKKRKICTRRY